MHNTTIKKQNKILLAALVVILAAAAILIAVTGGANRKDDSETPPLDNKITESGKVTENEIKPSSDSDNATIKPEKITSDDAELETPAKNDSSEKKESEKTDASPKTDTTDKTVSSVLDNTLPVFSAPIDNVVIKDYSDNIPVFSYTMNDYRTHDGLDFACSPGTPVSAAADGVICEIINDPMMGVTIGVQHSGGAITKYKGLSEDSLELKNIGDEVCRGDVIGASGETALIESAEEGHVHFEMSIEGIAVDPAEYMNVTFLSELYED